MSAREVDDLSTLTCRYRQNELKTTDADGSAPDRAQSCFVEQPDDLSWIDVAMAVKVREETGPVLRGAKVDDQHAPSWFEHAPDFVGALLAQFARQVVEHERTEHHVEPRVRERQRLRNRVLERHLDSCLGRLRGRPRNHRRGRVDAENRRAPANLAFRDNRQRSRATSDVEHRFARGEVRETSQFLAEHAIASMKEKPHEDVVARGPVQDTASCDGRRDG